MDDAQNMKEKKTRQNDGNFSKKRTEKTGFGKSVEVAFSAQLNLQKGFNHNFPRFTLGVGFSTSSLFLVFQVFMCKVFKVFYRW